MFYQLLTSGRCHAERKALIDRGDACSWSVMAELAQWHVSQLQSLRQRRVGLRLRPSAGGFAALAALDHLASDVFLLDERLSMEQSRQLARQLRLGAVIGSISQSDDRADLQIEETAGEQPGSGQSSVTILTSGTLGQPKAARHSWESLARPVRRGGASEIPCWMLTYRPQLYAGLQVILQCLANYGTLVVADADQHPDEILCMMRDYQVQYCSATPSYWRRLAWFADAALHGQLDLRQITLGGETVDQQLLDMLRALFPGARIIHIYATTETGRCFSVRDGRAGFPAKWLDGRALPGGVHLAVRNGELCVQSPNAMQAYDVQSGTIPAAITEHGWFCTGDLVEIHGDRVQFVGRLGDIINVGGNKVSPLVIEDVIRCVPGVADVRVFAKRSSLAGQLVACEIVPSSGQSGEQLRRAVCQQCQAMLAAFQQPRFIEIVEQIKLTDAAKKFRRG